MSPAARKVTIRMYNVGFGDAFVIRIPGKTSDRKILMDCGSIKEGDGGSIDDVVDSIIEDVKDKDGTPRIDVVVATHRHRDHVSGFASSAWGDVEVKEVWMPWTEDPADPEAGRIRDLQSRLALTLHAELTRLGADENLIDLAANALSNEAAMQTLHSGFAGNATRKFLPPRDRKKCTFAVDSLPGVTVHAMGPSFDEDVIANMEPPKGKSYLQLVESAAAEREDPRPPFPGDWTVDPPSGLQLTAEESQIVEGVGEDDESVVAAALDGAVNGTSLVLMFQVGKISLLFPGDAQWGTWNMILEDSEWPTLLAKTTFLKVGHHGSHNATPKQFVEDILPKPPADLWAMVSTIKRGSWPIPKKELMAALSKRTKKLVRSDEIAQAQEGVFASKAKLYVETEIPF
ncbi:MAG TPA: hypothetical protein VEO37_01525 [Thermoanaerobaculia bacterium]|nr:hypothetical protein [Thermoanaerobaculia bacterium]